jgi:hypothetical protein
MTNSIITNNKAEDELIVIADECGDTMWDAVLNQEITTCAVNEVSKNAALLLNSIKTVQECDATEAKLMI